MATAAAPPPFEYDLLARRVVFGPGAADRLAGEVERIGASRALVVASQPRTELLRERLGGRWAGGFSDVVQHVPVETATAAREVARQRRADCLVACGGGSAIGLAKAVALDRPVPIVALPTTYAGSEMTPIWGMTTGRRKQTGRDRGVAPAVVLYDPALTVSMPARLTASSGMNAVAHCAAWAGKRPAATPDLAQRAPA
jgi:maleylacetate reductase